MRNSRETSIPYDSIDYVMRRTDDMRDFKKFQGTINRFFSSVKLILEYPSPAIAGKIDKPFGKSGKTTRELAELVMEDLSRSDEQGFIGANMLENPEAPFLEAGIFRDDKDPESPVILSLIYNFEGTDSLKWQHRRLPGQKDFLKALFVLAEMGEILEDYRQKNPAKLIPRSLHSDLIS